MSGPTAATINLARKRFIQINNLRLERTLEVLKARQRPFLEALPVLLHYNHRMLPGYAGDDVPAGISGFLPTATELGAVKQFSADFMHTRKSIRQHDIHSIFLMGSAGSIAFSADSDLDIWLCHREDLNEQEIGSLSAKTAALEKWADSLGLEVHFFLMNAEQFRAGVGHGLSEESSGSAQHYLLLDEFYRTSLWLAGRIPLWWFVPPDQDGDYSQAVKLIRTKHLLKENEIIDFGGIPRVPVEEFFGAALWQVYKAIDSPYKSALKIILTESYAYDFPDSVLLCGELKSNLYAGELLPENTDPYLRLLSRVEKYLEARFDTERLDNARRYFYIKMELALTDHKQEVNWRQKKISELANSWGWGEERLSLLDGRDEWKIDRIKEEKNALVKDITKSYAFLSEFARQRDSGSTLRQEDLTVLGRKLFAAFERKAGKIEIVNLGIAPAPEEDVLTLYHNPRPEDEGWFLFRGKVDVTDVSKHRPLKSARGVVEMIAWCYFNGVIGDKTYFAIHSPIRERISAEIRSILSIFREMFPDAKLPEASVKNFSASSRIVRSALFVNVGQVPRALQSGLEKQIIDQLQEIFHFGTSRENLVHSLDQVIVTNWREVFVLHHVGMSGILDGICQYLQWNSLSNSDGPPPVKIHSFSSHIGQAIANRLKTVWDEVADVYFGPKGNPDARHVLEAENGYYVIYRDLNTLQYQYCDGYAKLLAFLERPQFVFSPIYAERYTLRRTYLPILFRANKAGVVQTFFHVKDDKTVLYVFDENGAAFVHETRETSVESMLHHFVVFLKSVTRRQAALAGTGGGVSRAEKLEFYEIVMQSGNPFIEKRDIDYERVDPKFVNITVLGEEVNGQPAFRIFCDNKEFSSVEHGERLFSMAANYIASLREGGAGYPCYITDVDLAPRLLGLERQRKIPTVLYLNYKKRIELRLDRALKDLGGTLYK